VQKPPLYESNGVSLPVTFEIIEKTERYTDKKTGKEKRRSSTTKNEHLRSMLLIVLTIFEQL